LTQPFKARRRRLSALKEVEEALTFACPGCSTAGDLVTLLAKGCLLHSLGRRREAMKLLLEALDSNSLVCWVMRFGVFKSPGKLIWSCPAVAVRGS
jgi:hypothetical protein